jgi:DNA (cytosine-5)-methyltransferase 1
VNILRSAFAWPSAFSLGDLRPVILGARVLLRGLDLFCGAGGSSRGAKMAGVTLIAAVDVWDLAEATYADNFPETRFYKGSSESLQPLAIKRQIGNVDILLASPECTSHTCAKGSAKRSERSRDTAMQVIRFAAVFKPKWIVVENVVYMRSWKRYGLWLSKLSRLGYHCRQQVLNATDFGVAQSRKRLFVMCSRESMPELVVPTSPKWLSARQVIDPNGKYSFTELRTRRRAKATLERADRALENIGKTEPFLLVYYGSDGAGGWQKISKPLRTITTVDRFAYVRPAGHGGWEMRMLQVPELQNAMGFPADHKFRHGTRRDRIKLLGNAVCPPVMEAVIRSLQNLRPEA